jgi:ABC-type multidrug transport system ATPase subunit
MGASGAGKSTLLDILATRIPGSEVGGQYLMNGKPISSYFKRLSGYVMQDDALFPLLTVRETLQV